MIKVRTGRIEDLKEILIVNKKTWKTAYKGILDESFLDSISVDITKEQIEEEIKLIQNKKQIYFVAEEDGRIVGIIRIAAGQENKYNNAPELKSLYVLEEYQRHGIGSMLISEALNKLKEEKMSKYIIGCLEDNSANEIYKRMGGIFIEKRPVQLGGKTYYENVYELEVK